MDILQFLRMDVCAETVHKKIQADFEATKSNPENMSYWLPKVKESTNADSSTLRIPETKVVALDFHWWEWLLSDQYTPSKKESFNTYVKEVAKNFLPNKPLFMKTGIFSHKFEFQNTHITNRDTMGDKFLNMFYTSLIVGAHNTSEVVLREFIPNNENRQTIYGGMALHTEFRVFYDFDAKAILGVSNYWHPAVMETNLTGEDAHTYGQVKDVLVADFHTHKINVSKEIDTWMQGVTGLTGKWFIDVMKNGTEYWLIDMARMEKSALIQQMERVDIST